MKWLLRFVTAREIVIFLVLIVALFAVTAGGVTLRKPFASTEMRFAEASKTGMKIIPASCPSDPHYNGECSYAQSGYGPGYTQGSYTPPPPGDNCSPQYFCTGSDLYHRDAMCVDSMVQTCAWGCSAGQCNAQCTLKYYCSGDDLYYGDVTYSYCQNNKVQTCGYGCSGSACLPPPAPTATITARPTLVHMNDTTQVIWSSTHTTDCSVTSGGGDSWPHMKTGTKTSKPITRQTTFTLQCTGEDGSTITKNVFVNIIPDWQEQ